MSIAHGLSVPLTRVALVAVVMGVVAPRVGMATPEGPSATDRQITLSVRLLMERQHISTRGLDDQASERCIDTFLKDLDPWKLYFYQSDVDEFNRNRHQLDDFVRSGDVQFAYDVFNRFMQRIEERSKTAVEMIDVPHDFTLDETMVRDRKATTYPKSPEEAAERWRTRVKFELMSELADKVELEEAKTKLRKRYGSMKKRWEQTSDDELLELYLTAMTSGFDPHSSYMSKSTLEDFNIHMRLELDGIGASLRSEDGYTTIQEIIPGGAADLDGRLKAGDQILGVGQGTSGPIEDIVDMKLKDVVALIRGKRGTVVRMEVKPIDNPKDTKIYEMSRARIELKNQEARSEIVEWGHRPGGGAYKIGIVQLPSFYMDMDGARNNVPNYKSTTRDVRRLLNEFNEQGVDAVVVDLRFNGGGSLTEAVNLTGLFIDQGPVVQVKGPDGRSQPYNDPEPGMVWSGPLAVITNKFSASASEIFAGAIQDYGRGLVIGDEATHGKGTVQQLYDLGQALFRIGKAPQLGALKMTIQQFYRPSGDSTQNQGVLADVTLPSFTQHLDVGESDLDYALPFDQVKGLRHDRYRMDDATINVELQKMSADRVAQSDEFQKDLRRIELYEQQKDRPTVTLNLEKFLKEREQLDADKEQEDIGKELSDSDRPVFDMKNHYNKEALSVVVDYLMLLKENKVAVAR